MDENARLVALEMKVAELESKLNYVMQNFNLTYNNSNDAATSPAEAAAIQWLMKGNKIEAIKVLREATGVGLKEAKEAIDLLDAQLRSAR